MCVCVCLCVFFQAEDGIRDLVRSRGLGDVYKRQGWQTLKSKQSLLPGPSYGLSVSVEGKEDLAGKAAARSTVAVSYTHLTLPTSDLV